MFRRTMLALVTILLTVPVTMVVPATAAEPALSVVADDTRAGGAWAAYRVRVPAGSQVAYDIQPTMKEARRSVASAWLLKADGSMASYYLTTGFSGRTTERHVQLPGGGVMMSERSGGMNGPAGLGGGWVFNTPGEYILLHVATSDAAVSSRLRLSVTDGVELLGKTMGGRTFVYSETSFRGTANVTVTEACIQDFSPLCPQAKVLLQQELTEPVAGRLFGNFIASASDPVLVHGYQGPASSASATGNGGIIVTNKPPGPYRFTVDANIAAHPTAGLALWGADVELPEPLVMLDDGFSTPTLTLDRGSVLQIVNRGTAQHNFTVDGTQIDVAAAPGESLSVPIDVGAGTYSFLCKLHSGMTGELTVRQP
jgi:hypothetical protein